MDVPTHESEYRLAESDVTRLSRRATELGHAYDRLAFAASMVYQHIKAGRTDEENYREALEDLAVRLDEHREISDFWRLKWTHGAGV